MSDSSSICLSCGLCCDGTLIGFVQLEKEELPALRNVMVIEEINNGGLFLQPCSQYCDGCAIYTQRPKACDHFKCELLKSVELKELAFDTAVATIELARKQKTAIEQQLATLQIELESKSFYFKMLELKTLLQKKKSTSILSQKQIDLITNISHLYGLLSKEFGLSMD